MLTGPSLAVFLLLAPPVQAQQACNQANAPFFTITELERSGFDGGTGHVVSEGDNFEIKYELRACVTIGDPNGPGGSVADSDYTPTAEFVLAPTTYHTQGWYLDAYGIEGAGNAEKAHASSADASNVNWRAVSRQTAANGVSTDEFTLTWTMYGTSTDNSCKGTHPDYMNAASVSLRLLNGGGSLAVDTNYFINVTDDDTASWWKTDCVSGSF